MPDTPASASKDNEEDSDTDRAECASNKGIPWEIIPHNKSVEELQSHNGQQVDNEQVDHFGVCVGGAGVRLPETINAQLIRNLYSLSFGHNWD